MTDLSSWTDFYKACCKGNLEEARKTITRSVIDNIDFDGNTALHIASKEGHSDIVHLLLRYHASRAIKNSSGKTAEDVAVAAEIRELVKASLESTKQPTPSDLTSNSISSESNTKASYFVATETDIEWLDNYENAHRIAYENYGHMKRWILKVPLKKLLHEMVTGYIDQLKSLNEDQRKKLKDYIKEDTLDGYIEEDNLKGLVKAYTLPSFSFHEILNKDLAEIGSNFRFLSTQNLFKYGYLDNEAPKELGQHIFASILINHSFFQPYYHTGTSYRGMNITHNDLEEYKNENIVMTRSFLSTSISP